MKSITERINESLMYNEGNDAYTREYNNLFGMMSDTLLRKLPCGEGVYVLTGSKIREGLDFLSAKEIGIPRKNRIFTPSDWFEERAMYVYDNSGLSVIDEDDICEEEVVNCAREFVKDSDYLIVCQ